MDALAYERILHVFSWGFSTTVELHDRGMIVFDNEDSGEYSFTSTFTSKSQK